MVKGESAELDGSEEQGLERVEAFRGDAEMYRGSGTMLVLGWKGGAGIYKSIFQSFRGMG